jgi:photosystem II stability/assembly factor-like uncharacterized protein
VSIQKNLMTLQPPHTAQQEDIVYGFAISADHVDENQPVLFAACSSGLYRSLDRGNTWLSSYLTLREPVPTLSVVLSPEFISDHTVFTGVPGCVLRSTDGGETWEVIQLASPPPFVVSLGISPNFAEDGTVVAATKEDGIFRSGDHGRHWTPWNFGLLDLNCLCLAISSAFSNDETIFAGVESGLFRSTNGGRAWREVKLPCGFDAVLSIAFSPKYERDGLVFVGTENNGLFLSPDRGISWRRLAENSLTESINAIILSSSYPNSHKLLVMHGGELLVSTDEGGTWAAYKKTIPLGSEITAIHIMGDLAARHTLLLGGLGRQIIQLN